jgi:replicative DNA helicase
MSDQSYPTAHDEEAMCLSALMRCGRSYRERAKDALRPQMFDRYRDLASIILSFDGRPDPDTVRTRYDGDGLEEVLSKQVVPANVMEYAEKVRQAYGSCRVLDEVYTAAGAVNGQDFQSVADDLQKRLTDVTAELDRGGGKDIETLCREVLDQLEEEQGETVTGIPSGFPRLDENTKGWQDGDLIVPFGSTSAGKTAFALCCALRAAKDGHTTVVHSLEMPARQLVRRLIQMQSRVNLRQTTIPDAQMDTVRRARATISDLPLHIREGGSLDPVTHRSRLRHLDYEHGIDLAVVDYLQEMKSAEWTDSQRSEVHGVASGLKETAIQLDIPVICPSQTNRSPDNRQGDKRPRLVDLRQAGEEPADTALGIYRPEYYGITIDEAGNSTEGKAEIIIAKQRNGEAGAIVELAFVKEHAAFEPLEKRPERADDTTSNGSPF